MAGLAAATTASTRHRSMVNANLVVRQFAETLKEHVRTGVVDPDTGEMSMTGYVSCASPDEYMYPYVTNPSAKLYEPPAGFEVHIDAIESQASTTYNVVLVIDKSSSIAGENAVGQVETAAKAFIDGLSTSSTAGGTKRVNLMIVSFGTDAEVETVDAAGNPRALSVTNGANVAALKTAVDNIDFGIKPQYLFGVFLTNGNHPDFEWTNWEDGVSPRSNSSGRSRLAIRPSSSSSPTETRPTTSTTATRRNPRTTKTRPTTATGPCPRRGHDGPGLGRMFVVASARSTSTT